MTKTKKPAKQKEKPKPKEKIEKRQPKPIQSLRGMKDILPKENFYWTSVLKKMLSITEEFGFDFMLPPVLEESSLYVRSIGRGTDIVDKEMYIFDDRDGTRVALRPEFTAGLARAYIQHGMHILPQPVKAWSFGPVFRHERPQHGRYREHRQFNVEVFGSPMPVIDAEAILMAHSFLSELGINSEVRLNSIGTPEDRVKYKLELISYYKTKRGYLCDDCKKRMVKNPLRLLDCKKEQCQPVKEDAPQILDWLSDTSRNHFMKVLEYLDVVKVPYSLDYTLVRGLDYYTHTLFEIYPSDSNGKNNAEGTRADSPNTDAGTGADAPYEENADETHGAEEDEFSEAKDEIIGDSKTSWAHGRQSALAGGGRYDLLFSELGGQPTPAFGFAAGVERVIQEIKSQGALEDVRMGSKPKIYLAQLGEIASQRALKIMNDLRRAGIVVAHNFGKPSLKVQLETANKLKVNWTAIIGQKEVVDGTVIVRDMESGNQEIIDENKLEGWLKREVQSVLEVANIKKMKTRK